MSSYFGRADWTARQGRRLKSKRKPSNAWSPEKLEDRTLLAFSATLVGGVASFVGGPASETLVIDQQGGLLRHNRFSEGDLGFNSDFDFDSTLPGDQTLPAAPASTVSVNLGAGGDTLEIGTFTGRADLIGATINVVSAGAGIDNLVVDFSAASAQTFTYATTGITTAAGFTLNNNAIFDGGIILIGSGNADTLTILSTFAGEQFIYDGTGGTDTVNIGSAGSAQTINAPVTLQNPSGFNNVTINNGADATGRTVGLNLVGGNVVVSGVAPANISMVEADTLDLTINLGSGADVVNVNTSVTFATTTINTGAGNDTINVAAALLGAGSINVINGGAGTDVLNVNAGGNTVEVIFTGPDSGLVTFGFFPTIEFTGIEEVNITNAAGLVVNGTPDDDEFLLRRFDATRLEYILNSAAPVRFLDSLDLIFNGLDGDDTATVDYVNGPLGIGTFTFNGGLGDDVLEVNYRNQDFSNITNVLQIFFNGGADFDTINLLSAGTSINAQTVVHNFTNANAGTIFIDGRGISYTGLNPIIDNLNAVDRQFIFNLQGNVTLGDNGVAGDNVSRISSVGLSETVDFVTPTGSLTVVLAPGFFFNDVTLNGLDSQFLATVPIEFVGAGDDTFTLADDTNIAWGTIANPERGIVVSLQPSSDAAILTVGQGTANYGRFGQQVEIRGFRTFGGLFINGDTNASGDRDVVSVVGLSDMNAPAATGSPFNAFSQVAPMGISAVDEFFVTDSVVQVFNQGLGALIFVNLDPTTLAALYAAGGNETGTLGDLFIPTFSPNGVDIYLDGMNPADPARPGDRLQFNGPAFDLYTDPVLGPPNYAVREVNPLTLLPITGQGRISWTRMETIGITTDVINVLGDRGGVNPAGNPAAGGVPEADIVQIDGFNPDLPQDPRPNSSRAFFVRINDLARQLPAIQVDLNFLGFFNPQAQRRLNIRTGTLNDRISVAPFASQISTWDIDVRVNGGTGVNRLAYSGVDQISNQLVLEANAFESRRGRIFDAGTLTNTLGTLFFQNIDKVNINANPNDGDTLRIVTTGQDDVVEVRYSPSSSVGDFNASNGAVSDDIRIVGRFDVVIDDGNGLTPGPVANGFTSVTLDTGAGNDRIRFDLQGTGPNVVIQAGAGNDVIEVVGNAGNDSYDFAPGADNESGLLVIGGTDTASVAFSGINRIDINGGNGGNDILIVRGNGASNSFWVHDNTARVDQFALIRVRDFGVGAGSAITLLGLGGNDVFAVEPSSMRVGVIDLPDANVIATVDPNSPPIPTINVNGGAPNDGDILFIDGDGVPALVDDVFSLTAISITAGFITQNNGGRTNFSNLGDVRFNPLGGVNRLNLTGFGGNDTHRVTSLGTGRAAISSSLGGLLVSGGAFNSLGLTPGAGRDSVVIEGTNAADTITGAGTSVSLNDATIDLNGTFESLTADGGAGNDTINFSGFTLQGATLLGGAGNDSLTGSTFGDVIDGGEGDDLIIGGAGNDLLLGGVGNDTFVINAGDSGADTIVGGDGVDAAVINGTNANDTFVLGANAAIGSPGLGAQFRLDVAGASVEGDLEHVSLVGGLGNDSYIVNDLSTTNLRLVDLDGGAGTDSYQVSGTVGADDIGVARPNAAGPVLIQGLSATVRVFGPTIDETLTVLGGAGDDRIVSDAEVSRNLRVVLNGGEGNDTLGAGNSAINPLPAGTPGLVLIGGPGNDLLRGSDLNDTIFGGAGNNNPVEDGNNTIEGNGGDDSLVGGAGDDTITGGAGNDLIQGGAGTDLLDGEAGNDTLWGGLIGVTSDLTDDTLIGGPGNDQLHGTAGNNLIEGGSGNDLVRGVAGDDTISGGGGDDTLLGGEGADVITGEEGDDLILGDADFDIATLTIVPATIGSGDFLDGGAGNDRIVGELGDDTILGGLGDDLLGEQVVPDFETGLVTEPGNDFIRGGEGSDAIYAGAGNDRAFGDGGDDFIDGGAGNDTLNGGDGVSLFFDSDTLCGGAGNDLLFGESGDDVLFGRAGDDTLYGGAGQDYLFGGEGNDFLFGEAGNDTLVGGDGNDVISGGDGNDIAFGGAGDDTIFGNAGNDTLQGGDGNDWLIGGDTFNLVHRPRDRSIPFDGDDVLLGEDGFDNLDGGTGNNIMDAGRDNFREVVTAHIGNNIVFNRQLRIPAPTKHRPNRTRLIVDDVAALPNRGSGARVIHNSDLIAIAEPIEPNCVPGVVPPVLEVAAQRAQIRDLVRRRPTLPQLNLEDLDPRFRGAARQSNPGRRGG